MALQCGHCNATLKNEAGLRSHHGKMHRYAQFDQPMANLDPIQYEDQIIDVGRVGAATDNNLDAILDIDTPSAYAPFDSREELQIANWIIEENITRSAIDRLAKIGIYNKDGIQRVFTSKNRTSKVHRVRELYPELGKQFENTHFAFSFGPAECRWNTTYNIASKDLIDILRSLMASDSSFEFNRVRVGRPPILDDIKQGRIYQAAQREIFALNPDGALIGIILSIDDTNLTNHSDVHNGRPLYITTANQSLESRRKRSSNAWRIAALLPVIQISQESMSTLEKKYIAHAKVEFNNRVLEVILTQLKEIYNDGFHCPIKQRQFYPRLIRCLSDMKEAWSLWGLKHMTCPVCVASKDDYNTSGMAKNSRPDFMLGQAIADYEGMNERAGLFFASELRRVNGHFPVRLAFSGLCPNAFKAYIGDILHQPKKGIFANLLTCLQDKLRTDGLLENFKERMTKIPSYSKVEHFGRSWFDVSKMTASNYRDMSRQMLAVTFDLDIGSLFSHFSEFLYYCHYVSHDRETLGYMKTSLQAFKREVEAHFFHRHSTEFKTPKYHILEHYVRFIEDFGSLVNGDTDTTEGMHPSVKNAYTNTNKKGSFVAQMARNLDEALLIKMLHNIKIESNEATIRQHLQMYGLVRVRPRLRLEPYKDLIDDYIEVRYSNRFSVQELRELKYRVYNGIHCIYQNTNDPEKDLSIIARAVPRWSYGDDPNETRYDFVILKTRPMEAGLAGIDIGRLRVLFETDLPDGQIAAFAVVRMLERVLGDTLLPVYKYTDQEVVVPTTLIVRNIHMVPRWNRPVVDLVEDPEDIRDIYDCYEHLLFNTHTDCAAWTYYYD